MKLQWLFVILALNACGDADTPAEPGERGAFDDMTGTLERAEQVEQKVMDQKQRIDEALQEADRPDVEPPS